MRWSGGCGERGEGDGSGWERALGQRGAFTWGRNGSLAATCDAVPWNPRRPSIVHALTYFDSQLICLVLLKVLHFICFANLLLSAFKYVSLPEESPGNMN